MFQQILYLKDAQNGALNKCECDTTKSMSKVNLVIHLLHDVHLKSQQ